MKDDFSSLKKKNFNISEIQSLKNNVKKDINLQIEENLKKEMNTISNKISVLVDLQKTRSKDLQIQIHLYH